MEKNYNKWKGNNSYYYDREEKILGNTQKANKDIVIWKSEKE